MVQWGVELRSERQYRVTRTTTMAGDNPNHGGAGISHESYELYGGVLPDLRDPRALIRAEVAVHDRLPVRRALTEAEHLLAFLEERSVTVDDHVVTQDHGRLTSAKIADSNCPGLPRAAGQFSGTVMCSAPLSRGYLKRLPADPSPVRMGQGALGGSRPTPFDRDPLVPQALWPWQIADAADLRLLGFGFWHCALLAACPARLWHLEHRSIRSRDLRDSATRHPRHSAASCRDCVRGIHSAFRLG
jgi:hypothetical protein